MMWPFGEGVVEAPRWVAVVVVLVALSFGGWRLWQRWRER